MLPNLQRIPSSGDDRAEQALRQARQTVDEKFLASITPAVALDLGRYGTRQTTVALRRGSIDVLIQALWATALGSAAAEQTDLRDVMVGLALPHVVARELGGDPAGLFTQIANRLPDSPIAQALVEFGARTDVDLASFGWALVETPDGPDFEPR